MFSVSNSVSVTSILKSMQWFLHQAKLGWANGLKHAETLAPSFNWPFPEWGISYISSSLFFKSPHTASFPAVQKQNCWSLPQNHPHPFLIIKPHVFGLWSLDPLLCLQERPSCHPLYYSDFLEPNSCFAWQTEPEFALIPDTEERDWRTEVLNYVAARKARQVATENLTHIVIASKPMKNCKSLYFKCTVEVVSVKSTNSVHPSLYIN